MSDPVSEGSAATSRGYLTALLPTTYVITCTWGVISDGLSWTEYLATMGPLVGAVIFWWFRSLDKGAGS